MPSSFPPRRRSSPCSSPSSSPRAAAAGGASLESPHPAPSSPASAAAERAAPTKLDGRPRLHPERPVRAVLPRRSRPATTRDGGPRRRVPEQDRPGPRHARRRRAPSTSASRDGTSVIPAVSQGIPVRYIATIYGKFPVDRVRQGVDRDHRPRPTSRARRSGIPGRYGSSLDHAPGPARVGRPDARRRRRSSSTRTSARAPRSSRARSMRRPASRTTSRSSSS